MTSAQAFLQAIIEEPDDDTSRLVYADWLEENGDDPARADFIRLQIQLARQGAKAPRHRDLAAREWQLFHHNRERWLGPLADFADPWAFRRGFPEDVALTGDAQARAFLCRAEELFSQAPLRQLKLSLGQEPLKLATTRALADLPLLTRLRSLLVLDFQGSEEGVRALLGSPYWTGLTHLCLRGRGPSWRFGALVADLLAANPAFANLEVLDLTGAAIGPRGLAALLAAPHLTRWTELCLAGTRLPAPMAIMGPSGPDLSPNVGEEGVVALAGSPRLSRVRKLDLRWNGVGRRGVQALLDSPHVGALEQLRLGEPDSEGASTLTPELHRALHRRFGPRLKLDLD